MILILMLFRKLSSPILLCLTLFSSVLAQDSQAAKKTEAIQAPTGNSIVMGRAIYDDTGQPATRHRVQLIASEALSSRRGRLRIPTAITNENGEFSLRRIAAGDYYVVASPVDQHSSTGQIFPFLGSADSVTYAAKVEQFKKNSLRITVDGQHSLAVNLRLPNPHFGTISGRVLDLGGKQAVGASVHLMSTGEKSFGASVLTDKQGEYRFWGLPSGEYIISASPPPKGGDEGEPNRRYEGVLGATYFPSTVESRNSPPVTVFPDRDTGNIEVTLIAKSLHSLASAVRMRGDSRPVSNANVSLSRREVPDQSSGTSRAGSMESEMSYYVSKTDDSGHWSMANIPDGAYRLRVHPNAAELTKQRFVQDERDLTVEGDVENLLIEVSEGSRLFGVVTIEGNSASPQSINIQANRFSGNASTFVRLDEAGTFSLTAVPAGEVRLSAFPSPQDKFYVKSIEANGLDLLRTNLTIAEGDEIKDVRIVISPNVGMVTGHVLSVTGDKPLAGINVLLRRVNDDKLRLLGGKLMGVTDERGNFILSAAPGVYLVLAWRGAGGPSAYPEAMDRALRDQGTGLTLLPSDRKQLDIRLP
jgi:5-hydroxyisourate hydrolase-like protein (transthyretin family)